MAREKPFYTPVRLTSLGQALADRLDSRAEPIITAYGLFLEMRKLYQRGDIRYLRREVPIIADYKRVRNMLIYNNIIIVDSDYQYVYRILSKSDLPADEIVCIVDPFCYLSHISAMQRYGLTDRRPHDLHITLPGQRIIRTFIVERMRKDYGDDLDRLPVDQVQPLTVPRHPKQVRHRKISPLKTVHYGAWVQVRGSFARIATVGQTFLDMVEVPDRCGGMGHVVEVWQTHARTYLNEIITIVDRAPKSIYKIRAGYILSELVGIKDPRIMAWKVFAQRGGSRVLNPSKPFVEKHSEEWMLSINV